MRGGRAKGTLCLGGRILRDPGCGGVEGLANRRARFRKGPPNWRWLLRVTMGP